jgi:hypothetical protein
MAASMFCYAKIVASNLDCRADARPSYAEDMIQIRPEEKSWREESWPEEDGLYPE